MRARLRLFAWSLRLFTKCFVKERIRWVRISIWTASEAVSVGWAFHLVMACCFLIISKYNKDCSLPHFKFLFFGRESKRKQSLQLRVKILRVRTPITIEKLRWSLPPEYRIEIFLSSQREVLPVPSHKALPTAWMTRMRSETEEIKLQNHRLDRKVWSRFQTLQIATYRYCRSNLEIKIKIKIKFRRGNTFRRFDENKPFFHLQRIQIPQCERIQLFIFESAW